VYAREEMRQNYRPLQHRNGVTRFKQVENQSRNHSFMHLS